MSRVHRFLAWAKGHLLELAFMSVIVVAALAIGVLAFGIQEQNRRIEANRVASCQDGRTVLQSILLKLINSTPEEYHEIPGVVLARYRESLLQNPNYRNTDGSPNDDKIDEQVAAYHEYLTISDPENCKT